MTATVNNPAEAPEAAPAADVRWMIIRKAREAEVAAIAAEKGVDVAFAPVDWETVLYSIWGWGDRPVRVDDMNRAKRAAAAYVSVVFRADRPGDLVASASREDGAPTFAGVPGADFEWTEAAMDAIDFRRCDRCNVRHDRVRVYLVRNPSAVIGPAIVQLGGQCAKSAAARLRAQLAFMNTVSKGGWGDMDEDCWASGSGPSKWGNPASMLVLAEAVIRARGYTKAAEGENSTKGIVAYLRTARDWRGYRDVKAALDEVDADELLAGVDEWMAGLADDRGDFARNVWVAVETGSLRLLGFLAYVPMGVRRMREDQAKAAARAVSSPYDPADDSAAARLATFPELGLSKRDVAKVAAGEQPSKGGAAKLAKCLAGHWSIMSIRSFDGFYGVTTYVTYQRTDGARVTWKASGTVSAAVGDVRRLRGTVAVELRESEKYAPERRISRVTMLAV